MLGFFFVLILTGAGLSLAGSTHPVGITLPWLPVGVGVVGAVIFGWPAYPVILVAALVNNLPGMMSLAFRLHMIQWIAAAVIETGVVILAKQFYRRVVPGGITSFVEELKFIGLVCVLPPAVGAVLEWINLATLALPASLSDLALATFIAFTSEGLSIALVLPLYLSWKEDWRLTRTQWLVLAGGTAGLALMLRLSFHDSPGMIYLTLPLLLGIALIVGQRGSTFGMLFLSMWALSDTAQGRGPFITSSVPESLLYLFSFLFSLGFSASIVAVRSEQFWRLRRSLLDELHDRAQRLESSETNLKRIIELVPYPIYVKNAQGRLILANHAFSETTGIPDRDFTGAYQMDWMGDKSQGDSMLANDRQVIETGQPFYTPCESYVDLTGRERFLNTTKVLYIPAGSEEHMVLGISIDITESLRIQETLRQTNEYLGTLLDAASAPILVWEPSQQITRFNPAFEQLTGRNEADMLGKPLDTLFPEAIRADILEQIAGSMNGQAQEAVEIPIQRADGKIRVLLWNSAAIFAQDGVTLRAVIVQGQDITERKNVEEAVRRMNLELEKRVGERTRDLSEANEFTQTILALTTTGFSVYDSSGQCVMTNDAISRMAGATREQSLAQNIHKIESWKKSGMYDAALEALRSGQPVRKEVHVFSTFGREVYLETTFTPFDSRGETMLLLTVNDDTEVRRREMDILQLNARLRSQAARLQSANRELEAFSYSVSHDLRSPLRAIEGFASILLEDFEAALPAQGQNYLKRIQAGALRMDELLDAMLRFSRIGRRSLVWQPVDLDAVVAQAWEELALDREGRAIEFVTSPLPPHAGDATLLRQALVNLLSNAVKFTRGRSPARIEVVYVEDPPAAPEGVCGAYCIRDNGVGFDLTYASRLFGVFQRMHAANQFEGTGIGLAIVQRVILRHSGQIWVQTEPEKGAAFYFTLGEEPFDPFGADTLSPA